MSETKPTPESELGATDETPGSPDDVYEEYDNPKKGSIAEEKESGCLAKNWKLWWSLALVGFVLTVTFGGLYGWSMIKTE